MDAVLLYLSATHPLLADGGQHARAALDRGALQIVFHRPQAAQLFAAPCAARATVDQLRQWGAVTGRLFGRLFVKDLNTAMRACGPGDKLTRQAQIGRHQRPGEATFPGTGEGHRMIAALIRHQGGDRAKGFGGMHGRGFIRLRAEQQRRREERPGGIQVSFTAETDLATRRD